MRLRFPILLGTLLVFMLGVFLLPSFAQRSTSKKAGVKSKPKKVEASKEVDQKQINEKYKNRVRSSDRTQATPKRIEATRFGITPAVRDLKPRPTPQASEDRMPGAPKPALRERFNPELPKGYEGPVRPLRSEDQALLKPTVSPEPLVPGPNLTFDGIDNVDNFDVFGFRVVPPDTNGDVGPNHYLHSVNLLLQVFDKAGNPLTVPFAMSDLFAGIGGPCAVRDDGDPIVLYDQLADRWLISQFFVPPTVPTGQCIAISVTNDPTGAYYGYEFPQPNAKFADYPKYGVWPNAYYMTVNQFNWPPPITAFLGGAVWAYERQKMLTGDPNAGSIYIDLAFDFQLGGQLPADVDGLFPPGSDEPGIIMQFAADEFGDPADAMRIFEFDPDFVTPGNSTFTELPSIPVPSFNPLTPPGRADIPQPGGNPGLDALGDRLMHRLQYRNFGTHETFVTNHTVDVNPGAPYQAGVRFYELHRTGVPLAGGTYTLNKAATLALDADSRWMGSVALDASGNMGIGYSVSGDATFPTISYSAMSADSIFLGEAILQPGLGAQANVSNRWGDYSAMSVDPIDECTFWYTNEYYTETGPVMCGATASTACWRTKIGNFSLSPGFCTTPETGTINGQVTNAETSGPVEGARIIATNTVTLTQLEAVTDASGNYSRLVPPGNYDLVATALNYEDSAPVNITVTAGGTVTTNFVLVPRGVLALDSVTIDDSAGNNDGDADPNECINLTITLENIGPGTASGISGTLVSNTPGVTIPAASATQSFPDAPPGGTTSNPTPFQVSISPAFPCGDDINLTLNVTTDDGPFTIEITLPTFAAEVGTTFTYAGPPVPIPDGMAGGGNGPPVDIPIVVSGVTAFNKLRVGVHITHTWAGDVNAELVGPDGTTIVLLFDDIGAPDDDNFGTDCPTTDGNDTILDDDAATSIATATVPFIGSYMPLEPLSGLNSQTPNGTWTLRLRDDFAADLGTLQCWHIEFLTTSCEDGGGVCAGSVPVIDTATPSISGGNGDGDVDANECLDVTVGLTNNGTATATGVSAVLSTTRPGVTITQNTSAYPNIAPGATENNLTPFSIQTSAGFDCLAGDIDFTLNVTTDQGNFVLTFTLPVGIALGTGGTFTNNTQVPIPDNDPNGVSSTINVSGITGVVGKVTVALYLTHTFNGDLAITLENPNGDQVALSLNNGGNSDNFGLDSPADGNDAVFDDSASTSIVGYFPGVDQPIVGSFTPEEALSFFNFSNPNGDWTLHVADLFAIDVGNIESWSITIETAECEDGGCTACSYEDLFNDGVLTYDELNPVVTESADNLNLIPTNKRAYVSSGTDFAGQQTGTITADIRFSSGGQAKPKAFMFTNWIDKKNNLEVQFNILKGRILIKHRVGSVIKKAKADFTFAFDTLYTVAVNYDGTDVEVTINGGAPVVTLVPDVPISSGIIAFASRDTTTLVDRVCATP